MLKTSRRILDALILIFTALLPLKFTVPVGAPEVPGSYHFDFVSLIFLQLPLPLFSACAAALLIASCVFAWLEHDVCRSRKMMFYTLLWLLLPGAALPGALNGTREYARQAIHYCFGLAAYAGTLWLALNRDETFARKLRTALMTGIAFAVVAGLEQAFNGLHQTRECFADAELSEAMRRQLASNRIFGPFPVSNIYGGYLAAAIVPAVVLFWRRTDEWAQSLAGRILLTAPVALAFGFLLIATGSRGALFALLAAGGLIFCFSPLPRKLRIVTVCACVAAFGGLLLLIVFGRGFDSMYFRLDYHWAALRMMFEHPLQGAGWGEFMSEYLQKKLLWNDETPHSPHQMLLFFGAQCGLAGFVAAGALLLFPILAAWRKIRSGGRAGIFADPVFLALLTAFLTLSLDFMLEMGIESPASAGMLMILGFLIFARVQNRTKPDKPIRTAMPTMIFACCALAAATLFRSTVEMKREAAFSSLFEAVNPNIFSDGIPAPEPEIRKKLEAALKGAPESPFVHAEAARFFVSLGQFDLAEQAITRAIELAPRRGGYYGLRAKIRLKRPSAREAEIKSDLQQVKMLAPKNPNLR